MDENAFLDSLAFLDDLPEFAQQPHAVIGASEPLEIISDFLENDGREQVALPSNYEVLQEFISIPMNPQKREITMENAALVFEGERVSIYGLQSTLLNATLREFLEIAGYINSTRVESDLDLFKLHERGRETRMHLEDPTVTPGCYQFSDTLYGRFVHCSNCPVFRITRFSTRDGKRVFEQCVWLNKKSFKGIRGIELERLFKEITEARNSSKSELPDSFYGLVQERLVRHLMQTSSKYNRAKQTLLTKNIRHINESVFGVLKFYLQYDLSSFSLGILMNSRRLQRLFENEINQRVV